MLAAESGAVICDGCVDIATEVFVKPQRVFAFEWCDCVFESAFGVVSLHRTKRDAFKAMVRKANDDWYKERREMQYNEGKWQPLRFAAWRVSTMQVHPANY